MATTCPERAPAGEAAPGLRSRRRALLATSLGFAVVQLDVSVVNVAVKAIGAGLGGGVGALQWVVTAYTVTFAAFILTSGALGDRIGAKRVFVDGFCLFTLASAGCGAAPSLGALVGARAVQGVGAAILVPASLSLLNHQYSEPSDRARAVGLYLAGASIALAGGPLAGGLLIASLGWRSVFFINVPVAALGIWLTARHAAETTSSQDRGVDLPGQLTAIVALVALVGATIEAGAHGMATPAVLGAFALALLSGSAFVAIERRSARPMLPPALFARRTFRVATAIGLLVNVCFYGLIFVLSLLFQREQGYSPLATGLALAPVMIAITAANLGAGRLAERLGPRRTVGAGALLMAASCAGLEVLGARTPYAAMLVQICLLGLGGGLVVPVITSETLGSVERSRSGVAAGTLNTMRQAGSAVGVALFGSLLAQGFVAGARLAFAISIALAAAIAAMSPLLE